MGWAEAVFRKETAEFRVQGYSTGANGTWHSVYLAS